MYGIEMANVDGCVCVNEMRDPTLRKKIVCGRSGSGTPPRRGPGAAPARRRDATARGVRHGARARRPLTGRGSGTGEAMAYSVEIYNATSGHYD